MEIANSSPAASTDLEAFEASRKRAFRGWLLLAALWLIALLGMRLVWGYLAEGRLQTEIDRIHAEGAPFFPDDFRTANHLFSPEDAAHHYEVAAQSLVRIDHVDLTFSDAIRYPIAVQTHSDSTSQLVLANHDVLERVRRARAMTEANWVSSVRSPMYSMPTLGLSDVRNLGRFLRMAAMSRAQQGDHSESLEIILDTFAITRSMDTEDGFYPLINLLVVDAIEGGALVALESITPALPIEPAAAHAQNNERPEISRDIVRQLIEDLLNDDLVFARIERVFDTERATYCDTVHSIIDDDLRLKYVTDEFEELLWGPNNWFVAKPMARLDSARGARMLSDVKAAALSRDHSNVVAVENGNRASFNGNELFRMSRAFSIGLMDQTQRSVELTLRVLALRQMAATALAIRMYEIDHGKRPATLDELVPEYLNAVPVDPFDPDGTPIRYLPDDSPPLLYSINANQVDHGGGYRVHFDSVDQNSGDLVYFLDGNRPVPEVPERQRRR